MPLPGLRLEPAYRSNGAIAGLATDDSRPRLTHNRFTVHSSRLTAHGSRLTPVE